MYVISFQLPPAPQLRFLYYHCCYGWMGSRGVKAKRAPLTSLASSLGTCLSWQMGGSCSDLFSVIVQAALMGGARSRLARLLSQCTCRSRVNDEYYEWWLPGAYVGEAVAATARCSGDGEAVARRHLRRLPSGSRPLTSFRVKD